MDHKITELIRMRTAWRTYSGKIIEDHKVKLIESFIDNPETGPFGNSARFRFVGATESDFSSLKDLGTYGFIKGAKSFIIGAVKKNEKDLEDYGYLMERLILYLTDLGLATCWLGASFNKSSFAEKMDLSGDEVIPAVTPVGYRAEKRGAVDSLIRRAAGSKNRKKGDEIFFSEEFNIPLTQEEAGKYSLPLEMVRLAPSASNKQPWRIIKDKKGNVFHFYLRRTKGYYKEDNIFKMMDLQRIDMGIAMCHFELTANELGLKGKWKDTDPGIALPERTQYVVSWLC